MKNVIEPNGPICQIAEEKYQDFCSKMSMKIQGQLGLHIFKDESTCDYLTQLCEIIFAEEIANVLLLLSDLNMGIVALDIPEAPHLSKEENAVYGVAIVMGVFNNIGAPNIDPINQLPFTLQTASHKKSVVLSTLKIRWVFTPGIYSRTQ